MGGWTVSSQKGASEQGSSTQCGNRLSHPRVKRLMSFRVERQ